MRACMWIVLAACGGGGSSLEVDESECVVGRLRYTHDLGTSTGEGDLSLTGHAFFNALGGEPGTLQLSKSSGAGPSMVVIRVEFEDLLAQGATVPARGFVTLVDQEIDAGNCETAGFSGRISDIGDGWKFTLEDLHASPYCSGASLSGS